MTDFWVQDQPGLHSEFQDNQGYTEKPCLKKKKKKKRKKEKKKEKEKRKRKKAEGGSSIAASSKARLSSTVS